MLLPFLLLIQKHLNIYAFPAVKPPLRSPLDQLYLPVGYTQSTALYAEKSETGDKGGFKSFQFFG
jgi:hypothetical protein